MAIFLRYKPSLLPSAEYFGRTPPDKNFENSGSDSRECSKNCILRDPILSAMFALHSHDLHSVQDYTQCFNNLDRVDNHFEISLTTSAASGTNRCDSVLYDNAVEIAGPDVGCTRESLFSLSLEDG